jgi:hypothetical protein
MGTYEFYAFSVVPPKPPPQNARIGGRLYLSMSALSGNRRCRGLWG